KPNAALEAPSRCQRRIDRSCPHESTVLSPSCSAPATAASCAPTTRVCPVLTSQSRTTPSSPHDSTRPSGRRITPSTLPSSPAKILLSLPGRSQRRSVPSLLHDRRHSPSSGSAPLTQL